MKPEDVALSGQMYEMYLCNTVYVRNNLKPEDVALSGLMNEMYSFNRVYVRNNLKPGDVAFSGRIRVVFFAGLSQCNNMKSKIFILVEG